MLETFRCPISTENLWKIHERCQWGYWEAKCHHDSKFYVIQLVWLAMLHEYILFIHIVCEQPHLAHLSVKLDWALLIVCCPSVCISVFYFLLQNHLANSIKLGRKICSIKGSQGESFKKGKIHHSDKKIFFPRENS